VLDIVTTAPKGRVMHSQEIIQVLFLRLLAGWFRTSAKEQALGAQSLSRKLNILHSGNRCVSVNNIGVLLLGWAG